jgi:hypothetical protein
LALCCWLVILPAAWEWARLASLSKIRDRMLYVGGVLAVILMRLAVS